MADKVSSGSVMLGNWGMALIAGGFAVVIAVMFGGISWTGAIFIGALVFGVLGALFQMLFGRPLPALRHMAPVVPAYAPAMAAPVMQPEAVAAVLAPGQVAAAIAAQPWAPADAAEPALAVPGEITGVATAAVVAPMTVPVVEPVVVPVVVPVVEPVVDPVVDPVVVPVVDPVVVPVVDPVALFMPAAAVAPVADLPPVAADGKPALYDAPQGGVADDLKLIKGIGPKLEAMLNRMGIWHFSQVASWRAAEVAWVDANLDGFKGRVARDEWVAQARFLAAGGETEHSRSITGGNGH